MQGGSLSSGPLKEQGNRKRASSSRDPLNICTLGLTGTLGVAGFVPLGCAERMRCLRVNRACFPFTPSGSVFMKNFLLLALWEYSFLAYAACS